MLGLFSIRTSQVSLMKIIKAINRHILNRCQKAYVLVVYF